MFFDRAEAQAGLSTERAMSRIRPLLIRDHSRSAVGRTWLAKSISSRATVTSSSGRAKGSKASCPFTVRATQAANSACFSACESARSAAKDSPSSSISSQSKLRPERSSSMASPGLQEAKSASFMRMVGRSAVSPDGDVERVRLVTVGEDGAAELEQHEVEGGLEVPGELGLHQRCPDRPQIVGKSDADAGFLARLGLAVLRQVHGPGHGRAADAAGIGSDPGGMAVGVIAGTGSGTVVFPAGVRFLRHVLGGDESRR